MHVLFSATSSADRCAEVGTDFTEYVQAWNFISVILWKYTLFGQQTVFLSGDCVVYFHGVLQVVHIYRKYIIICPKFVNSRCMLESELVRF